MIKSAKSKKTKTKSKVKTKRINPSYLLGNVVTNTRDVEHEIEEFLLGKKVEVRFAFGKHSGGEISGKIEKSTTSRTYVVSNEGLTKIPTTFGSRRSKDRGYFYFHLDDVSFLDLRPAGSVTSLVGIGINRHD